MNNKKAIRKNNIPLFVYVSPEIKDKIKAEADKLGISISTLVRMATNEYLEKRANYEK